MLRENYDTITKNKSSMPTCFKCLCGTVPCQAAAAGDAAADSDATVAQDPLPVPYRFTVSGNRACLHTVFKPASLGAEDGQEKGVRPELRPKRFGNHCHDTVLCIMAVTIYCYILYESLASVLLRVCTRKAFSDAAQGRLAGCHLCRTDGQIAPL